MDLRHGMRLLPRDAPGRGTGRALRRMRRGRWASLPTPASVPLADAVRSRLTSRRGQVVGRAINVLLPIPGLLPRPAGRRRGGVVGAVVNFALLRVADPHTLLSGGLNKPACKLRLTPFGKLRPQRFGNLPSGLASGSRLSGKPDAER